MGHPVWVHGFGFMAGVGNAFDSLYANSMVIQFIQRASGKVWSQGHTVW